MADCVFGAGERKAEQIPRKIQRRRCGARAIALSYVMQKCGVRHENKATIYTSGKAFAVNRANARGSDHDYKMSFRKCGGR